jgi:hypothetical protein
MSDVIQPLGPSGQVAQFCPQLDWANGAVVSIGAASAQSAALTAGAYVLTPNVDCYIAVGSNPTATTNSAGSDFLAAGTKWPLTILSGNKVAVIQSSSAGTLFLLPVKSS